MIEKLTYTLEQAIKDCKELWKEIEESGLTKAKFLFNTEAGKVWRSRNYWGGCPLCEYTSQQGEEDCSPCPLKKKYHKGCTSLGFHIDKKHTKGWLSKVKNL